MDNYSVIQKVIVYALPVLFAITVHEAAHAYAAKRFGDATAYMMGRMTLNPFKHIDIFGTILLPLLGLLMGGVIFGWAKPVPVNFQALRNLRSGMRWVALAGPFANLVMALIWAAFLKFAVAVPNYFSEPLRLMSQAGIGLNISLMLLNLLPILPLDGGRVVESLLPPGIAWRYAQTEPYGLWIILALLVTGLLSAIMTPAIQVVQLFIYLAFQLI